LRLGLSFASRARLASVLRSGLNGRVRCRTTCTIRLTLKIPRTVARRLHRRTTIGTARVRISGTGSKRVRIRLVRSARTRLGSVRRVVVTLSGSASDGVAGHSSRARKKIAIRR
jgi:hypothetical protein